MRRELQRQEWEREEEEAMRKPVGPIHYEDIRGQGYRQSTIRSHLTFLINTHLHNLVQHYQRPGISVWATLPSPRIRNNVKSRGKCWTCSEIRWACNYVAHPHRWKSSFCLLQFAHLFSFCLFVLQTTEQRTKREQLKDKRKAILQSRLAKIRKRKMKPAKLDGTDGELKAEDNEG